jgi:hypothetical protein
LNQDLFRSREPPVPRAIRLAFCSSSLQIRVLAEDFQGTGVLALAAR